MHPPRSVIASLYIDQFLPGEIGRAVAKQHGIPLYSSIQVNLGLHPIEVTLGKQLLDTTAHLAKLV